MKKTTDGLFMLNGIGIVVNTGITAALTVLFLKWIGDGLKAYAILLIPTLSILIPGMIRYMLLPFVRSSTGLLGNVIGNITTLQPVVITAGVLGALAGAFNIQGRHIAQDLVYQVSSVR